MQGLDAADQVTEGRPVWLPQFALVRGEEAFVDIDVLHEPRRSAASAEVDLVGVDESRTPVGLHHQQAVRRGGRAVLLELTDLDGIQAQALAYLVGELGP